MLFTHNSDGQNLFNYYLIEKADSPKKLPILGHIIDDVSSLNFHFLN